MCVVYKLLYDLILNEMGRELEMLRWAPPIWIMKDSQTIVPTYVS